MLAIASHRTMELIAESEGKESFAMRFVFLEAEERKGSHIAIGRLSVGPAQRTQRIEFVSLGDMEMVAVAVVFAGDIARQAVSTIGPPESGAVVGVVAKHLLGERDRAERLYGQVAIEQVPLLGGIFE